MTMWNEYKYFVKKQNFNHQQNKCLSLPQLSTNPIITINWLNNGLILYIDNWIKNIAQINESLTHFQYQPVASDGIASAWHEGREKVSGRASTYDIAFSNIIAQGLRQILPKNVLQRFVSPPNVNANGLYHFLDINPYLRLVRYELNGKLNPHYDGHYYFDKNIQTMMTCLIYLNDCLSGEITFLEDKSLLNVRIDKFNSIPVSNKKLLSISAQAGRVLLFDQYLLHQTEILKEAKNLILSDFIMEKITPQQSSLYDIIHLLTNKDVL